MSGKIIVSREKLVAIADAVREKTGGSESLTLDEMPGAIEGIQSDGDCISIARDFVLKRVTSYSDEEITELPNTAFYNYTALQEVYLPNLVKIAVQAFSGCSSLLAVNFPKLTSLTSNAFDGCSSVVSVNLPVLPNSGTSSFRYMYALTSFYAPMLQTIGQVGLRGSTSLKKLDLPELKSIGVQGFLDSAIEALILRNTIVCTIANVNAFENTPIAKGTGYVYVPAALVEEYKAATNWTTYASQIRAIEDYPEITGG